MSQFPQIDPTVIPAKFVNEGTVNVQALAQSARSIGVNPDAFIQPSGVMDVNGLALAYREKEVSQSATPVAPAPAPFVQPVAINTTVPENTSQVDWDSFVLNDQGDLEPATRQSLLKAGIPNSKIDEHVNGMRAIRQVNRLELAKVLPNGEADLDALIAWSNKALSLEQRQAMQASMNSPAGAMTLLGYFQQYKATLTPAAGSTEPDLNAIDTVGGGIPPSTSDAEPFTSKKDRGGAFRDPRYGVDPVFTQHVQDRQRATGIAAATAQEGSPTPGWVHPNQRAKHYRQ